MSIAQDSGPPKVSLLYDPKVRSIAYQVLLCAVIIFLAYSAVRNAADNLARAKIASGFGFWNQTAGFDISQTLIEYSAQGGTYGRAFWVGLLNTLLVAAIGIVLATIVGFLVGIARLSRNWLIGKLAGGYVELIRNVPLLLQLLFWYNAVLKALPDLRDSWMVFGHVYLNNRGFFAPYPIFQEGIGLVVGAFIAEVVRAGIMAVSKGQTEAAGALGLRAGPTLKLVVIPQAMRVIIPPLTNQYLNLTKNSSLAVFVGYPDLVQIFTGTVLNQTGQAVEVVMITMAVYLSISLVTSTAMNWYNARIALVERQTL